MWDCFTENHFFFFFFWEQEVGLFLKEWENFTVNIPELELLRKYYSDTMSWISRVDLILMNVQEREDQENVVHELSCIQKDGLLLQIQGTVNGPNSWFLFTHYHFADLFCTW